MLGLCVGPILYAVPHWRRWDHILDSFTLAAVGGLCVLHLLPEAFEHGGWMVLPLAALGLLLPRVLQGLEAAGPWLLLLGLIGHALLESAALGVPDSPVALGLTVVLHRVPVGLAVFALYHEHPRTSGMGWVAIGALMVATVLGFFAGPTLLAATGPLAQAALQAGVAGMLLHVVWEHGHGPHETGSNEHPHEEHVDASGNWERAAATLLGLAVVVGFTSGGHDHGPDVLTTFALLAGASAPWILALIVGAAIGRSLVGPSAGPSAERVERGVHFARVEVVDRALPWAILLGLAVAFLQPEIGGWSPLRVAGCVLLSLVAMDSLVRRGPRGVIAHLRVGQSTSAA